MTAGNKYERVRIDGKMHYVHRLVMEVELGRKLFPHEYVHHINGDKRDNRISNLELWVIPQPVGQRLVDLVAWVVENYPNEVESALERRRNVTQHNTSRAARSGDLPSGGRLPGPRDRG